MFYGRRVRKFVAVTVLALVVASCSGDDDTDAGPIGPLTWPIEQSPAEMPTADPAMMLNLSSGGWVSVADGRIVAGAATSIDGGSCVVSVRPETGVTGSGCLGETDDPDARYLTWVGLESGDTSYGIFGNLPDGAATVTIDGVSVAIAGDVFVAPLGIGHDTIVLTTLDGEIVDWD